MEAVSNSETGHVAYAPVEHIAAAGHYEAYIVASLEHLCSCLNEILRSLLIGHTAEEGDNLVLHSPLHLDAGATGEIHGIMDGDNLCRVCSVLVDYDVAGKVTHSDDFVCLGHTPLLKGIDAGVYIVIAGTVERSRVDVYHKRFAGELFSCNSGKVGEPVVSVDDIELILVLECDCAADHCVAGNLLHQIGSVFSGEFEFLAIGDAEILHLPLSLLLNHIGKIFRCNIRHHIGSNVHELHFSEKFIHAFGNRIYSHIAGIDDADCRLVLVTRCGRHHEKDFHVVLGKTLGHTVAGSTETSGDMGREFPTEHKDSHIYSSFLYLFIK